jgi:valyl-tRNA synthetase
MTVEKQNQLLVSNSLFQQQQKELERTRAEVKIVEENEEKDAKRQKDVVQELSEVVQSIKNIYLRCQASMRNKGPNLAQGKDSISLSDILAAQLELITYRSTDLIQITSEYIRLMYTPFYKIKFFYIIYIIISYYLCHILMKKSNFVLEFILI